MPDNSVTIIDNRNGSQAEFDILDPVIGNSCIDVRQLNAKMGLFTYDPGFQATASCKSTITYIDGDHGILRYRGYPIEQLAKQSNYLEMINASADRLFGVISDIIDYFLRLFFLYFYIHP